MCRISRAATIPQAWQPSANASRRSRWAMSTLWPLRCTKWVRYPWASTPHWAASSSTAKVSERLRRDTKVHRLNTCCAHAKSSLLVVCSWRPRYLGFICRLWSPAALRLTDHCGRPVLFHYSLMNFTLIRWQNDQTDGPSCFVDAFLMTDRGDRYFQIQARRLVALAVT